MFRISRLFLSAILLSAVLLPIVAAPVSAVTAALMDSIAPGVLHGTDGFGTATVLVPKSAYVTYLVRTDSRLNGKPVQIWTNTGKGWKLSTTRAVEADGSVHFFARVTGRIGFWAKFAGVKPATSSHGRAADVSTDGTTTIRVSCDEFAPTGAGVKSIVNRAVAAKLNATIRVNLCSAPSTGFTWGMVSLDNAHLLRVGHTLQFPKTSTAVGAAGTETWSVRLTMDGVGRTTLVYSQPWRGGEKAAWTLMLTVTTT